MAKEIEVLLKERETILKCIAQDMEESKRLIEKNKQILEHTKRLQIKADFLLQVLAQEMPRS